MVQDKDKDDKNDYKNDYKDDENDYKNDDKDQGSYVVYFVDTAFSPRIQFGNSHSLYLLLPNCAKRTLWSLEPVIVGFVLHFLVVGKKLHFVVLEGEDVGFR